MLDKEVLLVVKLTGVDEATEKVIALQEAIKSAKALGGELTDLLEKLNVNI